MQYQSQFVIAHYTNNLPTSSIDSFLAGETGPHFSHLENAHKFSSYDEAEAELWRASQRFEGHVLRVAQLAKKGNNICVGRVFN